MRFSALAAAFTLTAVVPALYAQEAQKTLAFPVEATMVRLSVAVVAELKEPLTVADFTVYDNGAKQTVTFFDARSLPVDISLFVDTSGSLSVKDVESGRIYLRPGIPESAKRFVDILKPGDRMEVIDFSHRITALQELTGDTALLRAAIDRLGAAGERTLLARALYLKLHELKRLPRDPAHPRRRILVFITDGVDTGSYISENALRMNARQAEASLYVLALQPNPGANGQTAREMSDAAQSRWLLQQLCKETGGAFLPALTPTDLSGLAKRVSAEMAAEYTIGWVPVAPEGKERWHGIQVAVRNVPSDRLRYRHGYTATEP